MKTNIETRFAFVNCTDFILLICLFAWSKINHGFGKEEKKKQSFLNFLSGNVVVSLVLNACKHKWSKKKKQSKTDMKSSILFYIARIPEKPRVKEAKFTVINDNYAHYQTVQKMKSRFKIDF